MTTQSEQLTEAVQTYHARRDRVSHPQGAFDKAGRWYPNKGEVRPCCQSIREPSRRYPYSLLRHCRSIRHIARLYDVSEGELRRAVFHRDEDNRLCAEATREYNRSLDDFWEDNPIA